jgi:hypothetical protein
MKHILSYVDQSTQNLGTKLKETIEKIQLELQTVEVSLDKRTQDIEEQLASIKEDVTHNKRTFQSHLEEVKAIAEQGSRPTAGANAAQSPTVNGNTSRSAFRHQFEMVAEHNQWSD